MEEEVWPLPVRVPGVVPWSGVALWPVPAAWQGPQAAWQVLPGVWLEEWAWERVPEPVQWRVLPVAWEWGLEPELAPEQWQVLPGVWEWVAEPGQWRVAPVAWGCVEEAERWQAPGERLVASVAVV